MTNNRLSVLNIYEKDFLQAVSTELYLSQYNAVSVLLRGNFYPLNIKVSREFIIFFSQIPVSILLTRRYKFVGTFTAMSGKRVM